MSKVSSAYVEIWLAMTLVSAHPVALSEGTKAGGPYAVGTTNTWPHVEQSWCCADKYNCCQSRNDCEEGETHVWNWNWCEGVVELVWGILEWLWDSRVMTWPKSLAKHSELRLQIIHQHCDWHRLTPRIGSNCMGEALLYSYIACQCDTYTKMDDTHDHASAYTLQ
jgi:hypothetical protein